MSFGAKNHNETGQHTQHTNSSKIRSIFSTPTSIKRLFHRFPLVTYDENKLPLRAPGSRIKHALYIFTNHSDAARNAPSFNPKCLKWQTYLNFHNVIFNTVPSSNHASPSGVLPFLLPTVSSASHNPPPPIPSNKLEAWLSEHEGHPSSQLRPRPISSMKRLRDSIYSTLLDTPIRLAYLHALYLSPSTFESKAAPLYIHPCSRASVVRMSLEYPLRAAALNELFSASNVADPKIDEEKLLQDAEAAFEALSVLLGDHIWFEDSPVSAERQEDGNDLPIRRHSRELDENAERPGLLDAAVFAYTHVVLSVFSDEPAKTPAARMAHAVSRRENLVRHRERILLDFYD